MKTTLQIILKESLPFTEVVAALVGIVYYSKLQNSYWTWFVFYLIFIAFESVVLHYWITDKKNIVQLYNYLIIPIEFLFFYWLFAYQSLKNKKLFFIFCFLYFLSFVPLLFYVQKSKTINEVSYIVGCLLLFVLVFLEFYKQINSEDILFFKQDKMFYINIGIVLFYIGSLPFFAFKVYLKENEIEIYNAYFTYFLLSANAMYLLFTASFIWGKPNK